MWSGCLESSSSPAWGVGCGAGLGVLGVGVPPRVPCHLTDKLMVSFRLHRFSPGVLLLFPGNPWWWGWGSKTAELTYYTYSTVKPRLLWVTFYVLVLVCQCLLVVFFLPGHDMPAYLAGGLGHKKEGLLITRVQVEETKMTRFGIGHGPTHVWLPNICIFLPKLR